MVQDVKALFVFVTAIFVLLALQLAASAGFPGPNGQIAFVTDRDDALSTEIYAMSSDGSGQVNLTNNPARDFDPAWSPDGTKIASPAIGQVTTTGRSTR